MEDWTKSETAESWDRNQTAHNPARVEQLDILLSILEGEYRPGKTIVDVGIGSGIVEEMLFRRIPDAYVVGIDSSDAMVELARKRLAPYEGRYDIVMHDLRQIERLQMPSREYQVVFSVQTIHNVEDEHKRRTFEFVHRTLEEGGLFLLLDRIAVDTPALFSCYKSIWKRLDRLHNAQMREGETFEEHVERVATRGDLPASLEQHLAWLREMGFEVACLHLHANRALFAARKAF